MRKDDRNVTKGGIEGTTMRASWRSESVNLSL